MTEKPCTFMVVGGYLGAGKTTSMMAFTRYLEGRGVPAAIIANDLGAHDLVDADYTNTIGLSVAEIAGGCICYQTENLVDKLRRFRDVEGKGLVMSDIPGCGIGALDHVYHKLDQHYHGEFWLAPFLAIADPERLRTIMPEKADINLPKEMAYLFDAQLKEADVIVLNKIDTLSGPEVERYLDFLRSRYPAMPVFAISARDGRGIAELMDYVLSHEASLKVEDIGYGSDEFYAAEAALCWYNRRFFVRGVDGITFDGNAFVDDFIEAARSYLAEVKRNVPHLKLIAVGSGNDFNKSSLIGIDYAIEHDQLLAELCEGLRVVVNVRAACESRTLDKIMDRALEYAAAKHGLIDQVFFTECFGMADEGR